MATDLIAPDAAAARIFRHPLRAQIFQAIVVEGETTPARIARRIGSRTENVSYHVRMLVEHGYIELAGTTAVRGALEHWYRVVDGAGGEDAWRVLAGTATLPAGLRDEFLTRFTVLLDEMQLAADSWDPSGAEPLVSVSWVIDARNGRDAS